MTKTEHKRVNDILLGPLERPALAWLAAHMPSWMTPDILTLIGVFGSAVILTGYALTNVSGAFVWLASVGFVINWLGDSLDGTLARHRKIERPKYGFFVDHTVDAFSYLLIFGGLGLSIYVSFNVAMLALVGYLLMSVLVYVDTFVTGRFKISYGRFGPTELRAIAVICNVLFFVFGVPTLEMPYGEAPIYDLAVLAIAAILLLIFITSTLRRARELSTIDAPGRPD
ncbi:MAG: CDP-alcohol phosphatidyltransferase family protein [Chloroflexota bacterium]|nr:MAG: CDP-alcohol phosphatidyltransferase family protein [Chloroflexota bacterium]